MVWLVFSRHNQVLRHTLTCRMQSSQRFAVFVLCCLLYACGSNKNSPSTPVPATACDPVSAQQLVSILLSNPSADFLRDYPVAIPLDDTMLDFNVAGGDASSLAVWDSQTKQPVPHWLEAYDPALGKALLWVKVSSLPSGDSRTLWLTSGGIQDCAPQASDGYQVFPFFSDVKDIANWRVEDNLDLTDKVVESPLQVQDRKVIQSDGTYNGAPGVVELPNGDWLLAYGKGTEHVKITSIASRRSHDRGVTWGPEVVEPFYDATFGPHLTRTPNGQVLSSTGKKNESLLNGAAYNRSVDGTIWSGFTFYDNPVSDTIATPTVSVIDGSDLYSASYGPSHVGTGTGAFLWKSTDDGLTWTKQSEIRAAGEPVINETAIAKVGPGRLLAISRADDGNTYGHFSEDMGLTWGPLISYTSQVGILELPQLIQVGTTLVLFGREDFFFTTQLVAFVSYDGGNTFRHGTVLDRYLNNPVDGGYCWPMLLPDQKMFVVHYSDTLGLHLPDIKSLMLTLGPEPQPAQVDAIHAVSHFARGVAFQNLNLTAHRYALDLRFRTHDAPAGNQFGVVLHDDSTQPATALVVWKLPSEYPGDAGFVVNGELVPLFAKFTYDQSYRVRTIVDETQGQQVGELLDDFGAVVTSSPVQPLALGVTGHSTSLWIGNMSPRRNIDALINFIFLRPIASTEPAVNLSRIK